MTLNKNAALMANFLIRYDSTKSDAVMVNFLIHLPVYFMVPKHIESLGVAY